MPSYRKKMLSDSKTKTFKRVNYYGLWSFYLKEVMRFLSIPSQSIVAPVVTSLLFLAVFDLAIGGLRRDDLAVSYDQFITPGLVMLAIMQNAFMNSSFSIVIAKVQGSIVDVIMPPLTPFELTCGYALGSLTRGLVVLVSVGWAMSWVLPVSVANWWLVIYYGASASLMLGLFGLLGGILADKFDHIAGLNNFVITPLAFLSGTFYSIEQLPPWLQVLSSYNPFFYLIDGFRYGVLGVGGDFLSFGIVFVLVINIILVVWCWLLLFYGVRVQS